MRKIAAVAVVVALVLFSLPVGAEEPPAVSLTIGGKYTGRQSAANNMRIHAIIAHHPDNRRLQLECSDVESEYYGTASGRDLYAYERDINKEGDPPRETSSPIYEVPPFFFDLPSGEYICTALLDRGGGFRKVTSITFFARR